MVHFDDAPTRKANMAFIRKSMNVPLLSRELEYELALAWRDSQDESALHDLVLAYNRLVVSTASRFRNYGLPVGDLIQEGVIGLLQAANRFEPERDVRFSTYATWWIRSAMQDFILRNWSIVRTGTTANQKSLFFNMRRLRARIEERSGQTQLGDSGRREVAETLNVPLRDVEAMEGRLFGSDQSLNATISDEGEESWQEFLADDRPSPEQNTIERLDGDSRERWIDEALGRLSKRERIIIERRRLNEEGITLEELGKEFGVSKERVRQLEHRALRKMRDFLAARVRAPAELYLEP